MTDDALRALVVHAYRDIARLGLIVGSSGNVSARLPGEAAHWVTGGMLITPSGASAERISEACVVAMSLEGAVSGSATPSTEWEMHAGIYQACKEAGFIIHTHADACTALACLHLGLPPFHYMVLQFGGADVRCAPYVTFGTKGLANAAVTAIEGRNACLLANHGMIVFGRSASEALSRAVALETLCRQYLMALAAGTPRLLTKTEMAAARERFRTYGPRGVDA